MQSDLRSDEDISSMTYLELQIFLCIIAINQMINTHNLRVSKCMSVAVEGDSFLEETSFQHWTVIPEYVSGSSLV